MIPKNITREHILAAIGAISKSGIPRRYRSRKFSLAFNSKLYPPKYVIAMANKQANGVELKRSLFNGGVETNSFLTKRGFIIAGLQKSGSKIKAQKILYNAKKQKRHNERCSDCKNVIFEMLRKIYGPIKIDPKINISAKICDYKGEPHYQHVYNVFQALKRYRGHEHFDRGRSLPRCDILVVEGNFLVELDESQHFTKAREIALKEYPKSLQTGYDPEEWKELCEEIKARDNDPSDRDETRAWYDTLRDFLPVLDKSFGPTIRIYMGAAKLCGLDPNSSRDVDFFRNLIDKNIIPTAVDSKLARIVLKGQWIGNAKSAKKVLEKVANRFHSNEHVDFLITCGAFLTFDPPEELNYIRDARFPEQRIINVLIAVAEKECKQLLDQELRKKLSKFVKYITIGVDSRKEKVSLSNVFIKQPHCELVALIDLKTNKYHWTGKSYPTTGQAKTLIRFQDIGSHFITTPVGAVMILGCHDLNIFSLRGGAVTKEEWRKRIREDFYSIAKQKKPEIVLHHPHTTDSKNIWTAAWNEVVRAIPTVRGYIGAGLYFNSKKEARSTLKDVLDNTKLGNTLDLIIEN